MASKSESGPLASVLVTVKVERRERSSSGSRKSRRRRLVCQGLVRGESNQRRRNRDNMESSLETFFTDNSRPRRAKRALEIALGCFFGHPPQGGSAWRR